MPKSRGRKEAKSPPAQSTRTVKMTPRVEKAMREQRDAFRKKFGRDPGPGDPVFFDPDADEPKPSTDISEAVVRSMRDSGFPAQFIYAYKKTGLLIAGSGLERYPPDAVEEWNKAIDEYFELEEKAGGEPRPDPRQYKTQIPELLARPLTRQEHQDVMACLEATDKVLSKPQSVMMRVELAAALLAHACSAGFDSAAATGHPGKGQEFYDMFERIAVRRARELYAQNRA